MDRRQQKQPPGWNDFLGDSSKKPMEEIIEKTQAPAQAQPANQVQHTNTEEEMVDKPVYEREYDREEKKLYGKVAVVSGGDSGIGRAVAVHMAREGADIAIIYHKEDEDARITRSLVEEKGKKAILIAADVSSETDCLFAIQMIIEEFGQLDILVNNAGMQHPQKGIENISEEQLEETFRTNIFSQFFLVKAALPYMKRGGSIINTASVTAYHGNPTLLDYSSTKGAIVSFTRSLSLSLVEKGIRVNAVAPGPIWTPLITSTFPDEKISTFGKNTPMKRAGQPAEVAPCFVFLASEDASYITGQVLHPNGGEVLNT
jgi:NAD(P)-dependent dehydrogenase (short-subunit alcohol dehydrogenase family)